MQQATLSGCFFIFSREEITSERAAMSKEDSFINYPMQITCLPIQTRPILPPKDSIYDLFNSLPRLEENDVLLITSKILAIHQGRCVKISPDVDKDVLIEQEAELFIPRSEVPFAAATLTVKENTLIPSAGIDESNGNGYYILWPEHTNTLLQAIRSFLQTKYKIKNLAVIATDSHSTPLRFGVLGISIGFCGLEPLYDYRGKQDIFGRVLKMTQRNVVDALAVLGVAAMGEGDEQTPMVIIRGVEFVRFTNENTYPDFIIPYDHDIYRPLLDRFKQKKATSLIMETREAASS